MITLNMPPVLEPDSRHGWQLVLSIGEAPDLDYKIPFRSIIAELAELLSIEAKVTIDLPPYEKYEDFVEGSLNFGEHVLGIYFEHSLAYLSFFSNDRSSLANFQQRLSVHAQR